MGHRPSRVKIAEGIEVDRHALRYVEEELKRHRARVRAVESRKAAIARASPTMEANPGAGRPEGLPSDPTHKAVLRLLADEELQAWERRVRRIEAGLAECTDRERRVLEMLFLKRSHQIPGVMLELHMAERTVHRVKNEGLYTVALAMGIVE